MGRCVPRWDFMCDRGCIENYIERTDYAIDVLWMNDSHMEKKINVSLQH